MRPSPERLLPAEIRRSYAAKLILALVGVAVVVGAFGGYIYVHSGTVLEADTEREAKATAEIEAEKLDEWATRMQLEMRAISESAAFQSDRESEIAVQLWDIVERDDDIEAAYYVNTRTDEVVTSTGSTQILSAESVLTGAGQERLTSVAIQSRREVFVSRPFQPYDGSAPVVLFVTGVPNQPDRAAIVVVNLEKLSKSLLHRVDNARFVVVNENGTVVMAEDERQILTRDRVAPSSYRNDTGFVTLAGDGRSREATAVGYAHLDSRPWVVTLREPTSDAYALQNDISTQLLFLLAVVVCTAAAIVATFGRSTVRAVRELSGKANELQSGNLDVTVETERRDELGDLFRAFESMQRSLKREIEETEAARRDAEAAKRAAEHAREESERLTRHVEEKADEYSEVMRDCANGDLARRMDAESRSGAMADIAESFNAMMDDVQEQNEQLEAVTGILSHDLRNPLTVARGRTEALAAETDSPHVEPLERSLVRMQDIIEDALVLARQSSVEQTGRVDMAVRARRAWDHVETGGATLSVEDATPVEADPDLLGNVFENLFRNAVVHAGDDVCVRVGTTDGGFYVADDGPGIPAEKRETVFELGHTTNRSAGGTGFGLAIVERIATAHGWEVGVTESERGGARFDFTGVTDGMDSDSICSGIYKK